MAVTQVVFGALAIFAFIQVSTACGCGYSNCGGYGYSSGYGNPCGCGGVVDIDTYFVPVPAYETVNEVTTVSCFPVVETYIEPGCSCIGSPCGYNDFFGGYGYGYDGYGFGYPGGFGGWSSGYPAGHYGFGRVF